MNINSLFIKSLKPSSHSFNHQIVRWRKPKKPFWLGIAKSKMFVIPAPKYIRPSEEKKDYARLTTDYNTHFQSLLNFIKVENRQKDVFSEKGEGNEIIMSPELEKMVRESLQNNEKWNAECAKLRDIRRKVNFEKEMEKAIKEVDEYEEKRMKQIEWLEGIVRQEKESSKSFITPENLDEAIDKCLDNVVCYDFAIDLQGNIYKGRESLPSPFKENENVVQNASEGV